MRNEKKRKKLKFTKPASVFLAVTLLLITAVGGTLAWLTAAPAAITNRFIVGNIAIDITETKGGFTETNPNGEFKMVPGCAIDKDPYVTVNAESEDCWLFVRVEESDNLDDYVTYRVNQSTQTTSANKKVDDETISVTHGGWKSGDGVPDGVYYRKVTKNETANQYFAVLGGGDHAFNNNQYAWNNDQVLTLPSVTENMMENAENNMPTLTFMAYAVQLYKSNGVEFTAKEAWDIAKS